MKKANNINEIALSVIFPNPDQPRKDFDQDKLDELAMSIKQYGVLEPIVVTPRDSLKDIVISEKSKAAYKTQKVYMIVAGERRYRASLLAGLETIPARVIEADDALVEELALLENIQREDLNIIEEGKAYKRLLDRGWRLEDLAKKLGYKKTGPIEDRVSLLNLTETYQALTIKGELTPLQAYEMSRVSKEKQDLVYRKIRSGELNTYNKLYAFVTGMIALENQCEIFALTPLTEAEEKSIRVFASNIKAIEQFINMADKTQLKHLEKTVFHSDITPERIDLLINSLQKIRRIILTGAGVKKAMQEVA